MERPFRIAVIGCGYWGINYVRLLSQLHNVELVAICDQDEERLKEVGHRFPQAQQITKVEDVLSKCDIDAAILATTATTHYKVAKPLLEAGVHLLIEKPITIIPEEAEELIALAKKTSAKLMVGHIFLFNSGINAVKSYIDKGSLGNLYYLYTRRTNMGPVRHDVNALWDLATHDVSIMNYLKNDVPEWVSAVGSNILRDSLEDVGFAVLGYSDGVLGHIHVSWAEPNKVREVIVVGSEQRISFDDLNPQEAVRIFQKGITASSAEEPGSYGEYKLSMRDGDIISPKVPVSEPLRNQVEHFLECLEEDKKPRSDGQSGLDVVRVMEAINASIQRNGEPTKVKVNNH